MRGARIAAGVALLLAMTARAQDALVVGVNGDRLRDGNGAGASLLWVHPHANGTITAGASFFALPQTRWGYATGGIAQPLGPRTMLNVEASLGRGSDDDGGFRYLLVRGGLTRELLPKRLYGEAEWLQVDVARRQNGILRAGGTWLPSPPLTVRGSLFQSITGDDDTTLLTMRGDYDFGHMTAIVGFSAGHATPVLLQQPGGGRTRVREVFAGVVVDAWTLVVTAGDDRQRVALAWRVPLPGGSG